MNDRDRVPRNFTPRKAVPALCAPQHLAAPTQSNFGMWGSGALGVSRTYGIIPMSEGLLTAVCR